jgi:transposase-like protein
MNNFTEIAQLTEGQAREHLEKLRWPNGVSCPHCGDTEVYSLKGKESSKHPVRKGVYKCKGCRKQFTVTVDTLFEGSHIPLNKWLMAVSLMCSSKKGISAHQLHRMLGITYKSAWFMAHRVRYAMIQPKLQRKINGIVEVDETYVGGKSKGRRGRGAYNKTPVVALVQRNGIVKSEPMIRLTGKNLKSFIAKHVDKKSIIMTDDFKSYNGLGRIYKKHSVIQHSKKQYVNGDVHTNTIEGYFSLLKRGINGVFHHVSERHLHRYLKEFDFRYNLRNIKDGERTSLAIAGIEGKRLLYRDSLVVA